MSVFVCVCVNVYVGGGGDVLHAFVFLLEDLNVMQSVVRGRDVVCVCERE